MVVNNVHVYNLEESIVGAKFPMATDIASLTSDITGDIISLANSQSGSGHDNFLNGIIVSFDLSFTIKAWTEMERYTFMNFISSQSTMHRITKFDLDNSYVEFVDRRIIEIMKEKIREYNELILEKNTDDIQKKYLEILYSNPCGFVLTAKMVTNYRQLKTIYFQRKYHKLPEWREFCRWIETLPHSYLIIDKK